MSLFSSDDQRKQVSAEEFIYTIFRSLLREDSANLFERGKFSDVSGTFRSRFEYEFDYFALWTVIYFSKHRREFNNVSQLTEKCCRALVRVLGDTYDASSVELEKLYDEAVVRFRDMDSDMQSDGGLTNLAVGIAERISPQSSGEDFFECLTLATDFFTALLKRHASVLESVEILD